MTAIQNALVVGGGIGGLTAAVALRRQGIVVDLVEVQPVMAVYGVGIVQPNNTLRALDKIGLAQKCVEVGAGFPGWRIHDSAGTVLMDAPSSNDAAPAFPPNNGITRPKLHTILMESAEASGARIRFGTTVDQLEDDGEAVDVRLTSGETGRYDLVVGCDGLYSKLRRRLFGDDHEPQATGQGVWRYNLPRPVELEWGGLFVGRENKAGLVPLSPSLMYLLLITPEDGSTRMDGPHLAEEMRRRLDGYTGLIQRLKPLITDPAAVVYRPMESMLLPAPWMKGRILLIGDAAHGTTPHLGQGAAMAIEDAVLLGELMGREAALPGLLDEFMRRRFARAKYVVESSLQIGKWELEEWQGVHNPVANPGGLLHEATLALLDEY